MKLAPVRLPDLLLINRPLLTFLIRCHHARKLLSRQEHGHCGGTQYPFSTVLDTSRRLTFPLQPPPLYLHVTSTTKEGLEKAAQIIDDLMQKELPNLVDERRFRRREPEQQVERDEFGRV